MTGMTVFKLCDRHRSSVPAQGLSCDRGGIFLGDCALVAPITDAAGRRTYRARPLTEINYVLSAAYGREVDLSVRMPGLHQAAIYMTEGKWALAQVAALQLYVPELPDEEAVVRLRKAEALLRFNPYHRPAGTPDGGQFTSQDGTSDIVPVRAESSSGSETGNPLPKSETPYVAKNYVKYKKPVGTFLKAQQ